MAVATATAGIAGSASAATTTYTGTTSTSSSSFDRPVANGTGAPTDLSDTATVARYSTYTYTPLVTGTYDIVSSVASPATGTTLASWDNYLVLYGGTFSASSPLTNVTRANDDDNNVIGVSALLGATLTAGTTYTVVTTGNTNGDFGTFTNGVSPSTALATGSTAAGATADLFGTGSSERYTSTAFTVSATGLYNFLATANYDNYLAVTSGAADPTSAAAVVLAANDDSDSATRAGFANVTLTAGTTYYLINSGTDSASSGTYVDYVSGVGTAVLVPEPALVGLSAVAAAGLLRRRRAR